jgi:hypothetical protein
MTPTTSFTWPIPDPWDWASFRVEIERVQGRPLLLVPAKLPPGFSSAWVTTGDADLIVYARDGSRTQRLREIAHQAAHILLGHQATGNGAERMFPHLPHTAVAAVLTIPRYSPADEALADAFASLVLARSLLAPQPGETAMDRR